MKHDILRWMVGGFLAHTALLVIDMFHRTIAYWQCPEMGKPGRVFGTRELGDPKFQVEFVHER